MLEMQYTFHVNLAHHTNAKDISAF